MSELPDPIKGLFPITMYEIENPDPPPLIKSFLSIVKWVILQK